MDKNAWSARAIATHPDLLREIHEDYYHAGAQIVIANTYGTSRHLLKPARLSDQFETLNRLAVTLARQARDTAADPYGYVAASMTAFASFDDPQKTLSASEAKANFSAQAQIVAEAGADLIMMEQMGDIELATYAIQAAVSTGLPVWVGFTPVFKADGGVRLWNQDKRLAEGVKHLMRLGGSVVTIMHTQTDKVVPALKAVRESWSGPMGVYAHSGKFVPPNWIFTDVISPEEYATFAENWVSMGVQLLGGCCGTGPAHVRALKERFG